jgi:hypothetical protein
MLLPSIIPCYPVIFPFTDTPQALFAIPVFNWDSSSGFPLVESGFKVYWAVTLPLTLFVFVFWALAMLLPWGKWFAFLSGGSRRKLMVGDVELVKRGGSWGSSKS